MLAILSYMKKRHISIYVRIFFHYIYMMIVYFNKDHETGPVREERNYV